MSTDNSREERQTALQPNGVSHKGVRVFVLLVTLISTEKETI